MRFIVQVLVIIILASILELFLPWWIIAVAAFIGGYLFYSKTNFLAGFVGIAGLWLITSVIIDFSASAPLTARVAAIFSVPKSVLFILTSVIGGTVGGFAAMAGSALRPGRRKVKY